MRISRNEQTKAAQNSSYEALLGGRGSYVARPNFKTSRVGVYKCLSLIVGFAVTIAIWLIEVVSCRDFILRAVGTFWVMSLVGIYPGRASLMDKKLRETTNLCVEIQWWIQGRGPG